MVLESIRFLENLRCCRMGCPSTSSCIHVRRSTQHGFFLKSVLYGLPIGDMISWDSLKMEIHPSGESSIAARNAWSTFGLQHFTRKKWRLQMCPVLGVKVGVGSKLQRLRERVMRCFNLTRRQVFSHGQDQSLGLLLLHGLSLAGGCCHL